MSRGDMGAYLGLTIESISRLLARFRDQGLIALDKRDIELLRQDRLEALLGAVPGEPGAPYANG